jgi:hypothetical protein
MKEHAEPMRAGVELLPIPVRFDGKDHWPFGWVHPASLRHCSAHTLGDVCFTSPWHTRKSQAGQLRRKCSDAIGAAPAVRTEKLVKLPLERPYAAKASRCRDRGTNSRASIHGPVLAESVVPSRDGPGTTMLPTSAR